MAFSVGECIRFGWETFKKRPFFLIGIVLLVVLISSILASLSEGPGGGVITFLLAVFVLAANILLEMGLVAFALKAERNIADVSLNDLWHPAAFWKYVGVKILVAIVVIVGLLLLVVPGVIAALMLLFSTYLVVDRGLGPIEAMKESVRITRGQRWRLFVLLLAIIGLNLVGVLAFVVGLVVSVPISLLAVAHAFRALEKHAGAAPSPAPAAA